MASVSRCGTGLMGASGATALLISAVDYLSPASGISGAGGTLLVAVASGLILAAALIVPLLPSALLYSRRFLSLLMFLGLVGTATAAYFLEAYAVLLAMMVGFLGYLLFMLPSNK